MSKVFYKDHTIVNSGRPVGSVENPAGFSPLALISWNLPDKQRRVMHRLQFGTPYATAEQAAAAALKKAKAWVDSHSVQYGPWTTRARI